MYTEQQGALSSNNVGLDIQQGKTMRLILIIWDDSGSSWTFGIRRLVDKLTSEASKTVYTSLFHAVNIFKDPTNFLDELHIIEQN